MRIAQAINDYVIGSMQIDQPARPRRTEKFAWCQSWEIWTDYLKKKGERAYPLEEGNSQKRTRRASEIDCQWLWDCAWGKVPRKKPKSEGLNLRNFDTLEVKGPEPWSECCCRERRKVRTWTHLHTSKTSQIAWKGGIKFKMGCCVCFW